MEQIIAGVDLGGTFIKFGLFNEAGKLLDKWQIPTQECAVDFVLKTIVQEIDARCVVSSGKLKGIGIGVPGAVNADGMLISAPNLGWSMLDIGNKMKEYANVPVCIGNDANVAALGEQYFGVGEGCNSMVMVTLGTGVGGGVIVNQRLLTGAFGAAGEFGHMLVCEEETKPCTCGNKGCLEQYASATGIVSLAHKMLKGSDKASILRSYETFTAKEVFDAVKADDALAVCVAEKFGQALGKALSCVAAVVDPEVFVIGGGVSAAGQVLLDYVEKYYRQYAFTPSKQTTFKLAALGNDAGICGAARLVMLADERE